MTTIYLDMDGVVADFDEYAARTLGLPPSSGVYPEATWYKLASNARIFRELKKTSYADRLVDTCRAICKTQGWDLLFLTATPKDNDMPWSFYDKVCWAQNYYPDIPVMFGPFSKDKHVHCKPGDILIDDRLINIEDWRAAGGRPIYHRGDIEATLAALNYI